MCLSPKPVKGSPKRQAYAEDGGWVTWGTILVNSWCVCVGLSLENVYERRFLVIVWSSPKASNETNYYGRRVAYLVVEPYRGFERPVLHVEFMYQAFRSVQLLAPAPQSHLIIPERRTVERYIDGNKQPLCEPCRGADANLLFKTCYKRTENSKQRRTQRHARFVLQHLRFLNVSRETTRNSSSRDSGTLLHEHKNKKKSKREGAPPHPPMARFTQTRLTVRYNTHS